MRKFDTASIALFLYIAIGLLVGGYSYATWLEYDFLLSIGATVFWPIALVTYAFKAGFHKVWY